MSQRVTNYSFIALIGAAVALVWVIAGSLMPAGWRTWGFDGLAYASFIYRIAFIMVAAILSMAFSLVFSRINQSDSPLHGLIPYLPVVMFFLMIFVFPPANLLRGDGQLLINNLSIGDPVSLRSPLYATITGFMFTLLAPFGVTPIAIYKLVALIASLLYLFGIKLFIQDIESVLLRVFITISLLFTGSLMLLSGLVENYAFLHGLMMVSLVVSMRSINRGQFPFAGLILTIIASGTHVSGVTVLPAFLFAIPAIARKKWAWPLFLGLGTIAVITASMMIPLHLLHPLGVNRMDGYTIVSLAHIIDLLNLDIWCLPVVLFVVCPLLLSSQKKITQQPSSTFLLAAAIGSYGFSLLFSPDYGMARDADLMALYTIPVALLLLDWFRASEIRISPLLIGAALFTGLITVGSQWFVQAIEKPDLERFIRQLERNKPRSAYGWEVVGIHLRENGDPAGEKNAYLKALDAPPDNEIDYDRYLVRLAQIALEMNSPSECIEWCNKLISRDPSTSIAYGMKGKALADMGDNDGALQDFEKAIEKDPSISTNYANLAAFLVKLNRVDAALEILKTGESDTPGSAQLFYLLGLANEKAGNIQQALKYYGITRDSHRDSPWGKPAADAHRKLSIMPHR